MKAIRVHETGGPDVLRYEDVDDPSPRAGELLVGIDAAGVNFIDIYRRTGTYKVPLPFIPGTEAGGTVVAVGAGADPWRVGDRVAYEGPLGAYAQYQAVPVARAVALPDGVSTRIGAAIMLQGMTAHYLATSTYPLAPGSTCLIHAAAGGTGQLLVQIAKRRGARVIGTVSSAAKDELARGAGADAVIRYTEHDVVAEVKRLTNGRGVDVVYDSVGLATFEASLDCLRPRGYLVLFGASSGPVPPVDPQVLNRKGSLYLTRPTLAHYAGTEDEMRQRSGELLAWVRAGELSVQVGAEFALRDAAAAHRALESRQTTGKVLLVP